MNTTDNETEIKPLIRTVDVLTASELRMYNHWRNAKYNHAHALRLAIAGFTTRDSEYQRIKKQVEAERKATKGYRHNE